MPSSRRNHILLLIAILAGAMLQMQLMDDGLGSSWPHNVVRNWQQFGFFNLRGQLITNPGGHDIQTAPEVYRGMSPLCLWPPYLAGQLFAWTGLGSLAFHFILALAVFWAIWEMLGRDRFAFLAAAAAILCPGYGRWQKLLDPNAISVLLGLPYAAVVLSLLKKPRLGAAAVAGLFALTLVFISLNWTTAWVLGPLALLLMALPQVNRRSLYLFVGLAGAGSVLFVGGSALNKAGGGSAGPGHLTDFLRCYLWGDIGYGAGLTSARAFLLLAFTNGVGLLTLWLLAGTTLVMNLRGTGRRGWLAPAPLLMAGFNLVVMRNYFGHHPWMAAPVLLAGLIFSLGLLRGLLAAHTPPATFKSPAPRQDLALSLYCLVCLVFGLAVLLFFRSNETNQLSLLHLIREHTARSDAIVIIRQTDPQLAQIADRFDEILDRQVVLVKDFASVSELGGHPVILSGTTQGNLQPYAQSAAAGDGSAAFFQRVAAWFNRAIAHRKPGDRLELADHYFLYDAKP